MLIKNGTLILPDKIAEADILVEGGKFKKIGRIAARESSGHEIIDAEGLLVFPGLIDSHVHLRDPEAAEKEDFYTGTCAALAGGFTTVLDMPNYRNPPTTTAGAYLEKLALASKKAVCDFGLHMGATAGNFEEVSRAKPLSIKAFLAQTGSELTIPPKSLLAHMKKFPKARPVLVHCELQEEIDLAKSKGASSHYELRGLKAAIAGVKAAIACAKSASRPVHICHVTSSQEVSLVRAYPKATCEVTPHHLFLSEKEIAVLGPLAQTNPPIRGDSGRKSLLSSLGKIDIIATDHAPHTLLQKQSGASGRDSASPNTPVRLAPSGVPGLETALPLLLDYSFKSGSLPLSQIAKMTSLIPAKIFGLKLKGSIFPGFDADLCLVDPKQEWIVKNEELFTKCKWSPFSGRKLRGKVSKAIVRGELAFDSGNVLAGRGSGKMVSY
jgi:dihydroorotase